MNVMDYQISGSAFDSAPMDLIYGLVYTEDDVLEIPKKYPFKRGWGIPESFRIIEHNPKSFPLGIEMCYLSICEQKFYEIRIEFPDNLFALMWEPGMEYITFGMAPCGKIAVWISGVKKSVLVCAIEAEETEVDMSVIAPFNPTLSLKKYCAQYEAYINGIRIFDLNIFDTCIKQYNYKYIVVTGPFDKVDNDNDNNQARVEFSWIEDSLSDGTYDKLHDDRLNTYHMGGFPLKCNIVMQKVKTEWQVSLWFYGNLLAEIFNRFYGAHPETKADFIIRIDAENKKYELALYRQGLKEPVVIPESAYQLIVFKNKFEDYRSENYNQPRGAWIW